MSVRTVTTNRAIEELQFAVEITVHLTKRPDWKPRTGNVEFGPRGQKDIMEDVTINRDHPLWEMRVRSIRNMLQQSANKAAMEMPRRMHGGAVAIWPYSYKALGESLP